MPMFQRTKTGLATVEQTNFDSEKTLQHLIEKNIGTVFNCRFVATEFVTGAIHGGRIDTLALSEDNNPVIIEYKKVESSELINQSLFYLAWIQDHRGDFEIAAQRALGADAEVDWSDIRVICIAPNFRKYDLHAVQVMGANLELWSYRFYKISQNIVCMEVQQKRLLLYLKLTTASLQNMPKFARDVSEIGHYGTGDLEISVKSESDLSVAKELCELAYQRVGG